MSKRHFGQNFLHDIYVVQKIISAIDPRCCDHLVEIGGGEAALTGEFLNSSKRFDVIEIDRDLIPNLAKICCERDHCFLHNIDVLQFDFGEIYNGDKLRVFGNLPYNISSPILFHLLRFKQLILDMHFMLQKEVAERMSALPHSKVYGRLSVMLQYHFYIDLLFDVAPESFFPQPKVESSFVRILPRKTYEVIADDCKLFEAIVRTAFNQRRKTIKNSLQGLFCVKNIADCMERLGIAINSRAEDLQVSDFVRISNFFSGERKL